MIRSNVLTMLTTCRASSMLSAGPAIHHCAQVLMLVLGGVRAKVNTAAFETMIMDTKIRPLLLTSPALPYSSIGTAAATRAAPDLRADTCTRKQR